MRIYKVPYIWTPKTKQQHIPNPFEIDCHTCDFLHCAIAKFVPYKWDLCMEKGSKGNGHWVSYLVAESTPNPFLQRRKMMRKTSIMYSRRCSQQLSQILGGGEHITSICSNLFVEKCKSLRDHSHCHHF